MILTDPTAMKPRERLHEIAAILALGFRRLAARDAEGAYDTPRRASA